MVEDGETHVIVNYVIEMKGMNQSHIMVPSVLGWGSKGAALARTTYFIRSGRSGRASRMINRSRNDVTSCAEMAAIASRKVRGGWTGKEKGDSTCTQVRRCQIDPSPVSDEAAVKHAYFSKKRPRRPRSNGCVQSTRRHRIYRPIGRRTMFSSCVRTFWASCLAPERAAGGLGVPPSHMAISRLRPLMPFRGRSLHRFRGAPALPNGWAAKTALYNPR